MANAFMQSLKEENNYTLTENGALTYRSTMNSLLDLFALGGAYRTRSDADCINLFLNAYNEWDTFALKCLFYLRDIRGGQGERRFFRVVIKYMANSPKLRAALSRNIQYIPLFGRWDDLYALMDTPLEEDALELMKKQFKLDMLCETPSLLAKWLKSENTSSVESCRLGAKTRMYFDLSRRDYRQALSSLRARIRVLETLMSAGRWEDIEFDKIPSKAGMIYRNAFARHDVERMRSGAIQSYADFAKDTTTKVNAKALYPYDVAMKAMAFGDWGYYYGGGNKNQALDNTERLMVNKYWDNLNDYFNNCSFNGICVADTSGSMYGQPLAVALSIAMYCAEHNKGDFANHFFTFSDHPTFMKIEGIDFVDRINCMSKADWGGSTNIEAVFDKMLSIAKTSHCSQDEIPASVIIISDMEFNACVRSNSEYNRWSHTYQSGANETLFETIEKRWNAAGYKLPGVVFWNVQARQDNIPMRVSGHVSYVSGFSPVLFEQILKGKTAFDLMVDKLNSDRYACIQ